MNALNLRIGNQVFHKGAIKTIVAISATCVILEEKQLHDIIENHFDTLKNLYDWVLISEIEKVLPGEYSDRIKNIEAIESLTQKEIARKLAEKETDEKA